MEYYQLPFLPFLPLPAPTCLYLPLPASSFLYLPLLASSFLYLPLPASTCLEIHFGGQTHPQTDLNLPFVDKKDFRQIDML